MQPDSAARLWEAGDAARSVQEIVKGRTWDEYQADQTLRWALERGFTIIGEALSQLRRTDPETATKIPDVAQIIGFRNVLVHGYVDIKHRVVWDAAVQNVPGVIAAITSLLDGQSDTARP